MAQYIFEDDIYTLEEFIACVREGVFTDYDGYGKFTNSTKREEYSNVYIMCNADWLMAYIGIYDYVVWFNK